MCGTCVGGVGEEGMDVHITVTCTKTQMGGMWKLTKGPARPSEAASSSSRQNVFFTQTQMAGASLLKSSGQ